jgi:zinc finger MYND domain-containing protein 10
MFLQLPEMRISILKDKNWSKIAKMQKEKYFTETAESRKKDMKRIMELYKPHLMEEFMEPPKCAKCGKTATQRCSRCKNEWYCSRECQVNIFKIFNLLSLKVKCWKTHKPICDVIVAGEKKKAAEDAKEAEIEEAEKKKKEVKKPLIQELEECD